MVKVLPEKFYVLGIFIYMMIYEKHGKNTHGARGRGRGGLPGLVIFFFLFYHEWVSNSEK